MSLKQYLHYIILVINDAFEYFLRSIIRTFEQNLQFFPWK